MTHTNILTRKLRVHSKEHFRAALHEGMNLTNAVMKQSFRRLDVDTLLAFFRDACSKRNTQGYVDLYPSGFSSASGDVRIAPTNAVLTIGVWLMNTAPEKMGEEDRKALEELMSASFASWIYGDGTGKEDLYDGRMDLLAMLAGADGKAFLKSYPQLASDMRRFLDRTLPLLREGVADPETQPSDAERMKYLLLEWDDTACAVFVYGTLMCGQRASRFLDGCTRFGRYLLRGYAMYDLGRYPGIIEQAGETVVGEVYLVPVERIPKLDAYEGEGSLYHRRTVTVEHDGSCLPAQVYVYAHHPDGVLMREPWDCRDEDRVWYACYGSNLSAERFRCYIEGGHCDANNQDYVGCTDKTLWADSCWREYPGGVYFGQSSGSWDGYGVAFYDPALPGHTYMRLYNISRVQLRDVQKREGSGPNWYGRLVTLGIHEDGCPICTFTSETPQRRNTPGENYLTLIRDALIDECDFTSDEAKAYLGRLQGELKSRPAGDPGRQQV